jgi:predicted ester cyclase
MRWAWQGTHRGTWLGVPPTGKVINGTGVSLSRVNEQGKALEERMMGDNLAVLVQMGAFTLPAPAPA